MRNLIALLFIGCSSPGLDITVGDLCTEVAEATCRRYDECGDITPDCVALVADLCRGPIRADQEAWWVSFDEYHACLDAYEALTCDELAVPAACEPLRVPPAWRTNERPRSPVSDQAAARHGG